ncbi:hypothetical protein [Franconibacter daqui]|uniref:hypothetical protein n=1 Tax=Franconibacter daqui TaxID=2047724 RepID=UPI002DB7FC1A|nr:hypothetical protein [Franconibacter daqui]MEB5924630.1 hypothetical protein [Franconibacter daqui]
MNKDDATKLANRALDIMFFNYPIRSAVGVVLGVIIWFGFDAYPVLFELLRATNSKSTKFFFSAIGYLLIHSKTVIEGFTGKILSEDMTQTLNFIEKTKVSKAQKDLLYVEAVTKYINALDKKDLEAKKEEAAED